MIRLCDWTSPPPLPISCAGWTGKQIKQFRRTLSHWHPSSSDPIERIVELQAAAKSVADSIHHHRPTSHPVSRPHWKTEIKGLLRLARRNPKCFFRRVKNAGLYSLKRANPPLQPGLLESLLHADPPFDATILEEYAIPGDIDWSGITLPTDEEVRDLCRVPRAKSAGHDGLPPYALYQLPDTPFRILADGIRHILSHHQPSPDWSQAKLVGLFKGSSDWCLAKAWRPIQIPSAIYRILMRWVTKQLQSQIEPLLSPLQFCRTGRSTAHGTLEILECIPPCPPRQTRTRWPA